MRAIIDSHWTVIGMTLLTVYALFFDDIRIIAFSKVYDDVFYGFTLLAILIYLVEILAISYAKPKYVGSFFFYLDIVSMITLIPDCGWIWMSII